MQQFWTAKVDNYPQFVAYSEHMTGASERRYEAESGLLPEGGASAIIPGYCGVCRKPSNFLLDLYFAHKLPDGSAFPNIRERLECQGCGLNTRMRGSLQFISELAGADANSAIYATEQISPFLPHLKLVIPT